MSAKTSTLTAQDVRRIAELARLDLSPEDITLFTGQLGDILGYFADLQALDTSGVMPTSHALNPPADTWRDDEPGPSLAADPLIANAPDARATPMLFRVPKVRE